MTIQTGWSFLYRKAIKMVIEQIRAFINEKREQGKIINQVIRDDVFGMLEKECIVLYYPLDDDIEGFHIGKPIHDEIKQFVFINTQKVLQEQVWTAGHELGHVWKVDQYVKKNCDVCTVDTELIIGKFTAELLIPCDTFKAEVHNKLKEYDYHGSYMSQEMMIELVTYLMNFFAVPAKAVIRRFNEVGYIQSQHIDVYLESFEKGRDLYEKIITEKQYTRLDKVRDVYSMDTLPEDVMKLEKEHIVKQKYIDSVRKMFHIDVNPESSVQLEFKG